MLTLNHDKTHVIIITNGDFPGLSQDHCIPNVKANEKALLEALLEDIGIPQKNIRSFSDKSAPEILIEFQKITKTCSGKDATLIAYYAGHGMPVAQQGLFWATHDTTMDGNELLDSTAIATSQIKRYIENCTAERKILISDCCYAAEFLKGSQGDLQGFLQKNITNIKGTFYMFSSGSDEESAFPVEQKEKPTFFTEALIRSLKEGIEPDEEFCTIGKIYAKIEENIEKLRAEYKADIPSPDKRIFGKAEEYILYRNPKYRNQTEIELDVILENPTRNKLIEWMRQHRNHPRIDEAIEKLQWFDSAEDEIKKVSTLPVEMRSGAYTALLKKLKKIPELFEMALTGYSDEKGMSAKTELDNSRPEDAGSIRTDKESTARKL